MFAEVIIWDTFSVHRIKSVLFSSNIRQVNVNSPISGHYTVTFFQYSIHFWVNFSNTPSDFQKFQKVYSLFRATFPLLLDCKLAETSDMVSGKIGSGQTKRKFSWCGIGFVLIRSIILWASLYLLCPKFVKTGSEVQGVFFNFPH